MFQSVLVWIVWIFKHCYGDEGWNLFVYLANGHFHVSFILDLFIFSQTSDTPNSTFSGCIYSITEVLTFTICDVQDSMCQVLTVSVAWIHINTVQYRMYRMCLDIYCVNSTRQGLMCYSKCSSNSIFFPFFFDKVCNFLPTVSSHIENSWLQNF